MAHFLLLLEHKSWGDPRYFAPAALFAAVGAAWLASAGPRARWLSVGWQTAVMIVLLLGSITAPIALTDPLATKVEAEARVFGQFSWILPRVGWANQGLEAYILKGQSGGGSSSLAKLRAMAADRRGS